MGTSSKTKKQLEREIKNLEWKLECNDQEIEDLEKELNQLKQKSYNLEAEQDKLRDLVNKGWYKDVT